jgi:hypothetical protein
MYEILEIRKASKRLPGKSSVAKIVFIPAILAIGIITGANLASPTQAQKQQQPQQGNFNANWLAPIKYMPPEVIYRP